MLDPDARIDAFKLVCKSSFEIADTLYKTEYDYYDRLDVSNFLKYSDEHNSSDNHGYADSSSYLQNSEEHRNKVSAIASIRSSIWNEFRYNYANDRALMQGIGLEVLKNRVENYVYNDEAEQMVQIIKQYEPDYEVDTSENDAVMKEIANLSGRKQDSKRT